MVLITASFTMLQSPSIILQAFFLSQIYSLESICHLHCIIIRNFNSIQCSSVQLLSHVQFFVTPWTAAHQASLPFTISQSLLKLMSIESMMPSNHLILCRPLLLPPPIFPTSGSFQMSQSFTSGGQSFSFSISPSNEYSGLIVFRMDWSDFLQ